MSTKGKITMTVMAAILLACLIAFSRLYLYVHYPTDVIVSVILGSILALIGWYLAQKVMEKLPAKLK